MINLISIGFDIGDLTVNAFNAILESDIIVNFDDVDLSDLDSYIKDKEVIASLNDDSDEELIVPLDDEGEELPDTNDESSSGIFDMLERSYSMIEYAIEKSFDNKVTVICSNERGINGISNLLIQMSSKYENIDLKIYPGISPIDYSSSLLGAPLKDFLSIDLNSPIASSNEIENKLKLALENDLIVFVHNLKANEDENANINLLKEIVNGFNSELLVGIANGNYSYEIIQFKDLDEEKINESSALVIGNRLTYKLDDYMVTSSDYIVKPRFISQNIDFFERYLKDETPKGIDYDCDYLPCHRHLESCDFCYCPFYPCADGLTGGEWIRGKGIWSCQHCDWVHLEEPSQAIREGLENILKEPNDLKDKHIELLKLRRQCLLKTLK